MKLGKLILDVMDRTGESYEDLAARAREGGYAIHRGTIHKLATAELRAVPRAETLRAVAAALQVPPEDVALSAIESIGIRVSPEVTDDYARAFVTITYGMSDSAVRRLLTVTRTLAEALEQRDDQGGTST